MEMEHDKIHHIPSNPSDRSMFIPFDLGSTQWYELICLVQTHLGYKN